MEINFNTSHVNVNPRRMCKCLSKIHISIHLTLMLITKRQSFIIAHTDFNTSHVNVNRWKALIFHLSKTNFNTSHVNVNHTVITKERRIYIISIHLMLMLIRFLENSTFRLQDFNTSHVNVNL